MNTKYFKKPLSLLIAATLILSGCATEEPVAEVSTEPVGLKVSIATPTVGNIEKTNDFTGRVMPAGAVYVMPKMIGEITAVNFEVGDRVNSGDILFEVDDSVSQLQVNQAEAGLNAAQAGLEQVMGATYEATLVQMEGQVKQAQSSKKWTEDSYDTYDDSYEAAADVARRTKSQANAEVAALQAAMDKLVADDVALGEGNSLGADAVKLAPEYQLLLSQQGIARSLAQQAAGSYENTVDNYNLKYNDLTKGLETVEISLAIAEEAYALASGPVQEEKVKTSTAQLEQARTGYELALESLSYARVISPISGVIEQKNVELYGMATQQQPSYVISDDGALEISFGVSATIAAAMSVGNVVLVESTLTTYDAAIVEISPMADANSGLFTVKAHILQDAPELMSGVAVKITAVTEHAENTILLPADSVYHDNGSSYVYLNVDGIAVKTIVTMGIVTEEVIEIVEGLTETSEVIVTWSPSLIDGVPLNLGDTDTDTDEDTNEGTEIEEGDEVSSELESDVEENQDATTPSETVLTQEVS